MNFEIEEIIIYSPSFFLDGTVKYWTPEGVKNKQQLTSYEILDDNSFIQIKQSGLYMIYSQVKMNHTYTYICKGQYSIFANMRNG